jgi:uncharacterized zinc-type alcohol dehydrogenase-like protein
MDSKSPLVPFSFERRELLPSDVQIEILFCGVCHSDLHQARNEWGGSLYPMVPGHEIIGKVTGIGSNITSFKVGQMAGVGVMVDSCRTCKNCQQKLEQYCEEGMTGTYNGMERDGKTLAQGGYSSMIVVNERWVFNIGENLNPAGAAPLLCAGITTYSPLKYAGVKKGTKVGIIGLGGLGHMGVKFAESFGAEVTVISTSPAKQKDAARLGAHKFLLSTDPEQMKQHESYFDVLLNTVSVPLNYEAYLDLLDMDGRMMVVGLPPEKTNLSHFSLLKNRRSITGSNIGGTEETQEMLDYCAEHNIVADIELIPIQSINEAFERILKSDVKYRFVIDMKTL